MKAKELAEILLRTPDLEVCTAELDVFENRYYSPITKQECLLVEEGSMYGSRAFFDPGNYYVDAEADKTILVLL